MSMILNRHPWMETPAGALLLRWEDGFFAAEVADVFGYHALQLGLPRLPALAANRMPYRWVADVEANQSVGVLTDFTALPFDEGSLDLLVLPHTLEWCGDAASCLREAERVLRPEGRLVLTGFNPWSLWGLRQRRAHMWQTLGLKTPLYLPAEGEFVGYRRLRDWLRVLNFEVQTAQFGCYEPAFDSAAALARTAGFNSLGARLWPGAGAVYGVSAIKRVHGTRLVRSLKPQSVLAGAPAQVAQRPRGSHRQP